MTQNEFLRACYLFGIDPAVALENDNVREVLTGSLTGLEEMEKLHKILETEF